MVPKTIPVVIMTPPAGCGSAERWMADGRQAAARDLVHLLTSLSDRVGPIFALAAEEEDRARLAALGAEIWGGPRAPFHFGEALAEFVTWSKADRLAYFGGASAPLLTEDGVLGALERLDRTPGPSAVVNNYYSTDWALLNHAGALVRLANRLPTDNPLGWILEHEAGFRIEALPPSAATRADIDTPADILMLAGHPRLGVEVREFLSQVPPKSMARIGAIKRVILTPASNLTIIGRSSSHLWQLIERCTQIWVRLMVEERGMVASGRAARGEVRTLVGQVLEAWGPETFVSRLASLTDAVVWDTRVWMASRGAWPSNNDRFAADLGWPDQVQDAPLRDLTRAIANAPIPIQTGGHGVVSGGLYAILETLAGEEADLPPG